MKLDNTQISHLINLYVKGQLNESQRLELNQWLVSKENKEVFDRLTNKHTYLREVQNQRLFINDKRKVWDTLQKKIYLSRLRKVVTIVSAASIILSICLYLVFNVNTNENNITNEIVEPGGKKAVLILGNGEEVDLASADTLIYDHKSGTRIFVDSLGSRYVNDNNQTTSSFNTINTGAGMEYDIILADGTHVWLNSNSKVRFPTIFENNKREIHVEGEVYFKVKKDVRSFYVFVGGSEVSVLGTEFNVRSYSDEIYDAITLVEGVVELKTSNNKYTMKPNTQILTSKENNLDQVLDVNGRVYGAWRNGFFVYNNVSLDLILKDLARWYQLEVVIKNDLVKSQKLSMYTQRSRDIDEILEIIMQVGKIKLTRIKNQIVDCNLLSKSPSPQLL
ncbi:FecR domain-containing protein [Flavobacteriaceae bacterium]|nr:FecR domain-containing protein [Flavobacteriaceae bacterium]